jgi:energy-coupling factor transport system permease protein
MSRRFVINLVQGDTYLQKLNGTTKLGLFLIVMVYTMMSFDLRLLLPLFILSWIGLASLKPDYKLILGLFGFIFMMNFVNIILYYAVNQDVGSSYLNGTRTVLIQFNSYWYLTQETLWYLSVRQFKMMTSFMISMVFILSITPGELASGMSGLKIPYKISTITSLAFRYIPEIFNDYETIKMSMQARGLELDKRRLNIFKRLKENLMILIPLIFTSFDRIGNIANGLDLRGFGQGKTRTYYCEDPVTSRDKLFRGITILLIIFCISFMVYQNVNHFGMWFPFNV